MPTALSMKEDNMKKTTLYRALSVALALVVLVGVLATVAFADGYKGKLRDAQNYLSAAEAASTVAVKEEKLRVLSDYLNSTPVDPAEEGYADMIERYGAQIALVAKPLLDAAIAEETNGHLAYSLAAQRLLGFLEMNALGLYGTAYASFAAELDEFMADYEAACKAARDAVEASTPFSDYDLSVWRDYTFNEGDSYTAPGKQAAGNFLDREYRYGNGYYTIRYSTAGHSYMTYAITDVTYGFVLEVDVTSYGKIPSAGITFENGSVTVNGTKVYPHFMRVDKDGNLCDNNKNILAQNVVRPGQWTHLAVVLEPEEFRYHYFVNDVHVGSADAKVNGFTYAQHTMRIGVNDSAGEYSIDNYKLYPGSNPRTFDRFEVSTDEELFKIYVASFGSTERSVADKVDAYDKATLLLSNYWDEAKQTYKTDDATLRTAVDTYRAYDVEQVRKEYYDSNRDTFIAYVDVLASIARSLDSIDARNAAINDIDTFTGKFGNKMTKDDAYREAQAIVEAAQEQIDSDKAALNFIDEMSKLSSAGNSAKMQSVLGRAEGYFANVDTSTFGLEGFEALDAARDAYDDAPNVIAAKVRAENSEAIIGYSKLLAGYPDEESWKANAETVEKYVLRVRDILYSGNYEDDFNGVASALAVYEPVNAYFYGLLQDKHIAYIEAQIERYVDSDTYVLRLGAVSAVRAYVAKNDIDYENAELAALIAVVDTYYNELEVQREDYAAVLKQNSAFFINIVTKMTLAKDYQTLASLRDEAYVYYYAIDASVEGCAEAIEYYDRVSDAINVSIESAARFADRVAMLVNAVDDNQLYEMLVECAYYGDLVEYGVDGYAQTLAEYNAARDAYMSDRAVANNEIAATVSAALSERTEYCIKGFLTAVYELLFA